MSRWSVRCLLGLAVLLLLSGCADRSLAGKYAGKREIEGPPHIAGQLAKVELDLKREGQFQLLNLSVSFEGDWEFKDGKVLLNVKSALGRPATSKEVPYLIPKEGGLEFTDPSGNDTRPVLLKKL